MKRRARQLGYAAVCWAALGLAAWYGSRRERADELEAIRARLERLEGALTHAVSRFEHHHDEEVAARGTT